MILSIIVILAVIAADVATKYAAALNLAEGEAVTAIPHVAELSYVENRGAAFGMLADHRWVFLVFSSLAIVGIVAYLFVRRPKSPLMRVALALVVGGGIGNMIERLAHGYVTDFINFTFVDFYVFNVADACVTVGCGLLILWMIADTVREAKAKKLASANGAPTDGADGEAAPEGEAPADTADAAEEAASNAADTADESPADEAADNSPESDKSPANEAADSAPEGDEAPEDGERDE